MVKTKKAIKRAFEYQLEGRGFTLVEILSQCPTDWHLTPLQAVDKIRNDLIPYYPLGVYREPEDDKRARPKKVEVKEEV